MRKSVVTMKHGRSFSKAGAALCVACFALLCACAAGGDAADTVPEEPESPEIPEEPSGPEVRYVSVEAGSSIQAAIDAVVVEDGVSVVLRLAAGVYDESLKIDRRVTLRGAGSGEDGTILRSTNPPVVAGGATYGGYKPIVLVAASGIEGGALALEDLRLELKQDKIGAAYQLPAVLLEPGASLSHIRLKNVRVAGTKSEGTPEQGLTVDGGTSVENLVIDSCEFSGLGYGIIIYNDVNHPTTARYVTVADTAFLYNGLKGLYAEKLSDAAFTRVRAENNGDTDRSPAWADSYNAGIDINLKAGTYKNLTFTDLTVTANGTGSQYGAGLTVKARGTGNDSSYAAYPAALEGVSIIRGNYTGNNNGGDAADIRFGETGKSNAYPRGVTMEGAAYAKLANAVEGLVIEQK